MAKKTAKNMKGVSCRTINGESYYYAHISGRKTYFGKGDQGRKSATAAKGKELAGKHEARELRGGLEVKHSKFMTFGELHKWYFAVPKIQNQKSCYLKLSRLKHLVDFFKNRPLNQFESDQQSHYRAFREKEKAAPASVDAEIGLLSAMFHAAAKDKLIPVSVMPGKFSRKEAEYIPRRTVTDDEYRKLLEKANPEFRDLLVCAYETGMRSSEIHDLKASQVRMGVKHISGETLDYIYLGIFDTKTGARRVIPISDDLKPVLKRRMQGLKPDDYVFTNSLGKRYHSKKGIAALMASTCRMAKVRYGDKTVNKSGNRDGIVFHCFRHTRVTKWIEAGFSDEVVRRASGHHSLTAYRAYVNITDALPIMNLVRVTRETGKSGTKSNVTY